MPKKYKAYITFGQLHKHLINGIYLDADCVAVFDISRYSEGTRIVKEIFGDKYSMYYFDEDFPMEYLKYFPRGLINIKV